MSQKTTKKRNVGQRQRQPPSNRTPKVRGPRQNGGTFNEQAPVAIGNRTFTQKARFISNGDRMTVLHSEYIGDITGSTSAFLVSKTVPINPGLDTSFPWLNQIASRYESYRFKRLNYRFNTERPTTESGYIAIVPDYDPTDPAPADKVTAFQYMSAAKAAPWQNLLQVNTPVDLNRRKTYFTREGNPTSSENLGLYDTGNIFICVGGNSGSVTLGQLWCDYEIEFITPQIDSNTGAESGKIVGNTSLTAASPFGSAGISTFGKNTLWTYTAGTSTFTFLRNFQGLCTGLFNGASTDGAAPTLGGTATINSENSQGVAGTGITAQWLVTALAGQTMTVTLGGAPTSSIMRVGSYAVAIIG